MDPVSVTRVPGGPRFGDKSIMVVTGRTGLLNDVVVGAWTPAVVMAKTEMTSHVNGKDRTDLERKRAFGSL